MMSEKKSEKKNAQSAEQGATATLEPPDDDQIVDGMINRLERLYQTLTGQDASQAETPYAPIPPERDPAQHVTEQLDRLATLLPPGQPPAQPAPPAWTPAVCTWQEGRRYGMCFDLPGVPREALRVELAGDVLEVEGRRPGVAPRANGKRVLWSEVPAGGFARRVQVHPALARGRTTATLRDGVLELIFEPVESAAEPERAVRIEVGS